MTGGVSLSFVRDDASLAALEPEWWQLWQRAPAATPFQSPGWLIPWWRAFKPGTLLTVAVRMGGRLVGLAPFYVEGSGQRARVLALGISISDYQDVLVEAGMHEPVLAAIANGYADAPEPWGEWEMTELAPGASALGIPVPAGCTESAGAAAVCPVLGGLDAADAPESALPTGMRRKLRMLGHRIDRHGAAHILSARDRDPDWWLGELWRLHEARWRSVGQCGLLGDCRLRAFHREAMPELIARKLLRLHALVLGKAVVGIYYGFHHNRRAHAYLGGFDPSFSYYSPGTVLVGHAVGRAAAEGARELHFLRGGEAYKYAWGATDRWNSRRVLRRHRP
jgi:CelD/BcsL family acetyltransferase involved in cellulose biosynthesis